MRLAVLTYGLLFSLTLFGQEAKMVLEQSRIRIGEQAVLHFYFTYEDPNDDALIGWPYFESQLTEDIEIIDRTVDYRTIIDSVNGIYQRDQKLIVTAFEEGEYAIPPQKIEWNDSAIYTNPEYLKVETVKVDTSKGIMPNKDNYEVPYSFGERTKDWLLSNWYWLAGIGLAALIFFIVRAVRRNKEEEEIDNTPKIPAHITALKLLYSLKEKEAWTNDNKKRFYSDLTNTVRRYLEQRFEIYAMEKTTREIIKDLQGSDISDEDKEFLRKILSQADMVKFAKVKPDSELGLQSLERSIEFVDKTKKEEENEEVNGTDVRTDH